MFCSFFTVWSPDKLVRSVKKSIIPLSSLSSHSQTLSLLVRAARAELAAPAPTAAGRGPARPRAPATVGVELACVRLRRPRRSSPAAARSSGAEAVTELRRVELFTSCAALAPGAPSRRRWSDRHLRSRAWPGARLTMDELRRAPVRTRRRTRPAPSAATPLAPPCPRAPRPTSSSRHGRRP